MNYYPNILSHRNFLSLTSLWRTKLCHSFSFVIFHILKRSLSVHADCNMNYLKSYLGMRLHDLALLV